MVGLTILTLALAPSLFWLWFFYRLDREPEPKGLVLQAYLWGVVAILPVTLIDGVLTEWIAPPEFSRAALIAPVVEEIAKFLAVRCTLYRRSEFDEPLDGIIYGVAAALGFASLENVFYLLGEYFDSGSIMAIFLARALLSVPGHALYSSLWGYALGWAKFSSPRRARILIAEGLLLAVILHGVFNGLLSSHPLIALGLLILVPIGWRMANCRIEAACAGSPHQGRGRANPQLAQQVMSGLVSGFHPFDRPQFKISQTGKLSCAIAGGSLGCCALALGIGIAVEVMAPRIGLASSAVVWPMITLILGLGLVAHLVGIVLAGIGLLSPRRRRGYPMAGLLSNGAVVILALIGIGLALNR